MQTHLNPKTKTDKQKNRAKMKTLVLAAKHAQNKQENINPLYTNRLSHKQSKKTY